MNLKTVLGLDAAQADACIHLNDLAGHCLGKGRVAKSASGWRELLEWFKRLGVDPHECLCAIEATGEHHLPWCEALTAAGALVLALNPLIAKRTTPVGNAIRDHKDDPIDAEGLACTAARDGAALARFTYRSDPARLGLRKLMAVQQAVRAVLTNLKKNAGSLQELVFPEVDSVGLSELRLRRLLRAAPTPARIARLSTKELQQFAADKVDALLAAAQSSFAPAALAEACAPALQALLGIIDELETRLRAIERQITAAAPKVVSPERLALAQSLPGFGVKTTPVVLAYVPDELWTRQQARKKKVACLQALFGIDPRVRQSGKWKGRVKLSKRGCRPARTALYQIAFCSIIHDPQMRAYYHRLTKIEKKHHKVALFDIARKHLRRLVAVLTSGHPYQPRELPAAA